MSCFRFINHFIQHHRHLHQLATRQLQDAQRRSKINSSAFVSRGFEEERRPKAEIRMTYFTGQLSQAAIDGVAHLEIRGGKSHDEQQENNNPDFADLLQCELVGGERAASC
ncbi:hypothetical protein Emed_003589 [Eimeria media]